MKANGFSTSTPVRTVNPATHDQIAALAHAIWIDRGCPLGCELDHWLEAQRQLSGRGMIDDRALDPAESKAATIDRELGRMVSPPEQRSPTSL